MYVCILRLVYLNHVDCHKVAGSHIKLLVLGVLYSDERWVRWFKMKTCNRTSTSSHIKIVWVGEDKMTCFESDSEVKVMLVQVVAL